MSAYKYVIHDPEGKKSPAVGGRRVASRLRNCADYPWAANPRISTQFDGNMTTRGTYKRFATEREAALFVDKWMLSQGRAPVNILKPAKP